MATFNVTDTDFDAQILKADKPVILDYWAEWCGPCKMIAPILGDLSNELTDVKIAKLNIDENPETPGKYGVRGLPTLMLFKGGEVIATKVGVAQKSHLKQWVEDSLQNH